MRSRQNVYELELAQYYQDDNLFGHMPIVIVSGDFLRIRPSNDISLAGYSEVLKAVGKTIYPEHAWAQEALLSIRDVILLYF